MAIIVRDSLSPDHAAGFPREFAAEVPEIQAERTFHNLHMNEPWKPHKEPLTGRAAAIGGYDE